MRKFTEEEIASGKAGEALVEGIEVLLEHLRADYKNWQNLGKGPTSEIDKEIRERMYKEYCETLGYKYKDSLKYIRVITRANRSASVLCFIVNVHDDPKFKFGDILKPAGWKGPTRNFVRGSVIGPNFKNLRWTGA